MRISDWSSDVCSSDLPIRKQGEILVRSCPIIGRRLAVAYHADIQIRDHWADRFINILCDNGFIDRAVQTMEHDHCDIKRVHDAPGSGGLPIPIGRASWRERGCQYV